MNIFVLGMSLVFLWLFPSWAQLGFVLLGITTTAVAIYAWREMQG